MKRVHPSGASKRKLSQLNKDKAESEAKVNKKVTDFFAKKSETDNSDALKEKINDQEAIAPVVNCAHIENGADNNEVKIEQIDGENNRMCDPAMWKTFSEEDIQFWLKRGPSECQNHEGPFENSLRIEKDRTRRCTPAVFMKSLPNGERVKREHILYSLLTGAVFCFVCKLFGDNQDSSLTNKGFSDWKNLVRIDQHENSKAHKTCLLTYFTRKSEISLSDSLSNQIENEFEYWRNVLKRTI